MKPAWLSLTYEFKNEKQNRKKTNELINSENGHEICKISSV